MRITKFSDKVLLEKTQILAQKERAITLEVLQHLREIERRSLYAEIGYSSLFEYAVKELKYSEGAAQRRISSVRLIRDVPEVEEKIKTGKLSLSALSQAQVFFRQEKIGTSAKLEILESLEGKSSRIVERELALKSSQPEKFIHEKLRTVSKTHTELKFLVDEALLNDIEELRCLLGVHASTSNIQTTIQSTMQTTVAYAVRHAFKKLRPKNPKNLPPTLAVKISRYVPQEIKRQVWKRDSGQCTYQHKGNRCLSKFALELDHVKPFSNGGTSTPQNLRLRCRAHNQLTAIKEIGFEKMANYIPRIQKLN